jgi:hypothetical protein
MDVEKNIEELLKGKILDERKCICDYCGRKGKLAATAFDRNTGEILVMCLSCDLRHMAEQYGITIAEARRKRKKRFDVLYLFQEVKYQEYFTREEKIEFDSVEEFKRISERVQNAWNALTTEERRGFEDKSKTVLKKIYKTIKVEFPQTQGQP